MKPTVGDGASGYRFPLPLTWSVTSINLVSFPTNAHSLTRVAERGEFREVIPRSYRLEVGPIEWMKNRKKGKKGKREKRGREKKKAKRKKKMKEENKKEE